MPTLLQCNSPSIVVKPAKCIRPNYFGQLPVVEMPRASRQRRTRSARVEATAVPNGTAQDSNAAPSTSRSQAVLPILTKLKSEDAADRLWSCAGLCNLISEGDANLRRLLGSHKVVDLLIERMDASKETDVQVRAEAVGAARNLAVEGGAVVCAEASLTYFSARASSQNLHRCTTRACYLSYGLILLLYRKH